MNAPFISKHPSRRLVLKGIGGTIALLSSTTLARTAFAQSEVEPGFAFNFDDFTARMRDMAATPFAPVVPELAPVFAGLDYDSYRRIQYRPDHGKWMGDDSQYQVQAFHMGWLFPEPVKAFAVKDGTATPMGFTAEDFEYHDDAVGTEALAQTFPGVAGIRINYPMNSLETLDEVVSFLGASYFRALGRNNLYGLSARGLLIDSWSGGKEEFPRFTEFYVERPIDDLTAVTIYAALESASVTGAYRFVLHPATDDHQETIMDVTARLFFRADINEIGIAPLTSMFLYAETNRGDFDDYRPQVHDSNGLLMETQSGDVIWRALSNTANLGSSYLWQNNPKAFGLYQRGRDFETYQDAGAHYERRPSARIEPVGDWGQGMVRLIEVPSRLEVEDNVVAFWIPTDKIKAGDEREFSYRLLWGDLNPRDDAPLAHVMETRAGIGGVSGVAEASTSIRKFVIDFQGGELANLPEGTTVDVMASANNGKIVTSTLSQIDVNGVWRVVIDVEAEGTKTVELKAYLVGLDRTLSEIWLYQWRAAQ